ncbi:MAG: DUF72 domain-containing protein [Chloroflexi bacterium]|nr:DUF72 domain-containing protein [Chloroflexota bacterium]
MRIGTPAVVTSGTSVIRLGTSEIRLGTCSWTDPTLLTSGWYPERIAKDPEARLRYYAERFPIVENDAAYYALPDPKQAALWRDRTPDGFTMSFKAYAPITTHPTETRRLPKDIREALPKAAQEKKRLYPKDLPSETLEEIHKRFWTALEPLRQSGKLGAILLQYPDWFVISRDNKEAILRAKELLPDDTLAVEFRNGTWMSERNREETLRFLSDNGLTYVSVDEPQGFPSSIPPVAAVTNAALAIVRFHGRNSENWQKKGITAAERFDHKYSKPELFEWIPRIRTVAEQAREVHLLMNNCYGDKAVNNARELGEMLAAD